MLRYEYLLVLIGSRVGSGGVEMHIYQLSQCLMDLGFYVIVITHYRGDRIGVSH